MTVIGLTKIVSKIVQDVVNSNAEKLESWANHRADATVTVAPFPLAKHRRTRHNEGSQWQPHVQ
jgi:hypothetical protein